MFHIISYKVFVLGVIYIYIYICVYTYRAKYLISRMMFFFDGVLFVEIVSQPLW